MSLSIADMISWVLLTAGSFFLVVGAIGLIRMPDVFTRMHAVSVSETLGIGLILLGLLVQAGATLIGFKLVCLFALIYFTGPVASHAVARAALADGLKPILAGPEIDARKGRKKPSVEGVTSITTAIDEDDGASRGRG